MEDRGNLEVRPIVYDFVKKVMDSFPCKSGNVLEIGSLDVNGSLSDIFIPYHYVAFDMRLGKNVNLNARANYSPFKDDSFCAVVCCDTLEHDEDVFGTLREMKRVLAKDGIMIIAVPGIGFKLHEYPSDYWRFTRYAVELLMKGMRDITVTEHGNAVMGYSFK